MQKLFISHSSNDTKITQAISDELEKHGLSTWLSFRDIPPGKQWDREIERAIYDSACVVVICSAASVNSSYVRAEVEEAIRRDKTVIPVLVEKCELPIRWKMRQWLKWNHNSKGKFIEQLTEALPKTELANFKAALNDADGLPRVRAILRRHFEWLPMEYWMRPEYEVLFDARIKGNVPVDVFAARMDSRGPRAIMYYFGLHNIRPFTQSGEACNELKMIAAMVNWHVLNIRKPLPKRHRLLPENLFASQRDEWRRIGDYYTSLNIYALFGRRKHYLGSARKFREKFLDSASQRWGRYAPPMEVSFELLSYDRILSSISRGTRIEPPRTD
jgi:hypothetical protein